MATETDELADLKARVEKLEALLLKMLTVAQAHPMGRRILKMLDLS